MTRQDMIYMIWDLVVTRNFKKAFDLCNNWNAEHPDEEIFMMEDDSFIAVEDDLYYF